MIKRTRKRQIEKAKLMGMSPQQRFFYKRLQKLGKVFASVGVSTKDSFNSKG